MPADYGRLSALDEARLRAARRRAGIAAAEKKRKALVKQRDSRTVSDVRRETADREKAKRDFPTPQSMASPGGIARLRQLTQASAAAGRNDYGRGTVANPKPPPSRTAAELKGSQGPGTIGRLVKTFVKEPIEDAAWAVANPIDRITGKGRAADGQMMWPGAGKVGRSLFGKTPTPKLEIPARAARPAGADEIIAALPEARKLRGEQERLRAAERRKRTAKAREAAERAGGGEAGLIAGSAALKGELPRLSFGKLAKTYGDADSELRAVLQPQVDESIDFIRAHPAMEGLEFRIRDTQIAYRNMLDGKLPTKSEERHLTEVFGEEVPQFFKHRRAIDKLVKVVNVPRAAKATGDLSFPFRQGLVSGVSHPRIWARSWGPMLKAARSEEGYQALKESVRTHPKYDEAQEMGLAITDLDGSIRTVEEAQIGHDLVERLPLGLGKIARGSNRAYDMFASKFRMDLYDFLTEGHAYTAAEKRDLTSIVNAGTGRGNMGSATLEKAAPFLTLGFFSPRLISSRISLLNPVYYAKLSKPARKEMRRSVLGLVGTGSAVLFLAEQMGADVVKDPRNADFGKIRLGDTRIDIWGGFGQYVVNGYRIVKGESVSSTTGELKKLEGGFAKQSRYDIFTDFATGKAAPVPGFLIGSAKGKKGDGTEFDEAKEAGKLFAPLGWQSAVETGLESGPEAAAATLGLGGVGIGVQTYGTDPIKVEEAKKRMALAKRGPVHVRDHEDRMATLTAAAKAAGLPTSDPAVQTAVASSRRIRNLEIQLRRATKKKGANLSYEERAKIVGPIALRAFPEYRTEIKAELASKDWERVYKMLRHELRAPYEEAVG